MDLNLLQIAQLYQRYFNKYVFLLYLKRELDQRFDQNTVFQIEEWILGNWYYILQYWERVNNPIIQEFSGLFNIQYQSLYGMLRTFLELMLTDLINNISGSVRFYLMRNDYETIDDLRQNYPDQDISHIMDSLVEDEFDENLNQPYGNLDEIDGNLDELNYR